MDGAKVHFKEITSASENTNIMFLSHTECGGG